MDKVRSCKLRYVSKPNRGDLMWKGKRDAQKAVYDNRPRILGNREKRLRRRRGEKLERTLAYLLIEPWATSRSVS